MAPYVLYQKLPEIYSITIAFHLSIAYGVIWYGFVLGAHQQYLRRDKHWMNRARRGHLVEKTNDKIHVNQILF